MNPKAFHLIVIFTCAALLLAGCLPDKPSPLGAGADLYAVPEQVRSEQKNILEYVTTSSRLASPPPSTTWLLDKEKSLSDEYRFYSGSWLMIIYSAAEDGSQQVFIIDTVHDSSWCGYIKPDGQIVDACFTR